MSSFIILMSLPASLPFFPSLKSFSYSYSIVFWNLELGTWGLELISSSAWLCRGDGQQYVIDVVIFCTNDTIIVLLYAADNSEEMSIIRHKVLISNTLCMSVVAVLTPDTQWSLIST